MVHTKPVILAVCMYYSFCIVVIDNYVSLNIPHFKFSISHIVLYSQTNLKSYRFRRWIVKVNSCLIRKFALKVIDTQTWQPNDLRKQWQEFFWQAIKIQICTLLHWHLPCKMAELWIAWGGNNFTVDFSEFFGTVCKCYNFSWTHKCTENKKRKIQNIPRYNVIQMPWLKNVLLWLQNSIFFYKRIFH